ncbi:hypothetical protein Tco_0438842 [Tanacetum coccineum]
MENSEFSKSNDRLLEECMFKDIMCIILCSFKDIDDYTDMACQFLEKTKECERLEIELSKQKERVGNELDNELSKRFVRLEEHSISIELSLQHNKEFLFENSWEKHNKSWKQQNDSLIAQCNYKTYKINDFKASLQDKTMANCELQQIIRNLKGNRLECNASGSGSNTRSNTMNNRIPLTSSSCVKNKEVEDHLRKSNKNYNECGLSTNHDLCVSKFLNNVNAHAKAQPIKKHISEKPNAKKPIDKLAPNDNPKKEKEWKPTGKIFTTVEYKWIPTGRNFTTIRARWIPTGKDGVDLTTMETIHVQFDELTAMASKQSSSGPVPQLLTFGLPYKAAAATSLTTIEQDAPSPTTPIMEETKTPITDNSVEEQQQNLDVEFDNDTFTNPFATPAMNHLHDLSIHQTCTPSINHILIQTNGLFLILWKMLPEIPQNLYQQDVNLQQMLYSVFPCLPE